MNLVAAPWELMTLTERVRYLLGCGCSAEEIQWATSVPATEIERLAIELNLAPIASRQWSVEKFDR